MIHTMRMNCQPKKNASLDMSHNVRSKQREGVPTFNAWEYEHGSKTIERGGREVAALEYCNERAAFYETLPGYTRVESIGDDSHMGSRMPDGRLC